MERDAGAQIDLGYVMGRLAQARSCFHSEADFQFALAWQVKLAHPDAHIRLEVPQQVGNRVYKLDFQATIEGRRTATGLKYYKAPLSLEVGAESFSLIDAVAHDINRYDFLKDVQRMEHVLAAGLAEEAYAVLLTNQPKYWEPRLAGNRVDEMFGMEEGRTIAGELSWAPHVGGTNKGREHPITLAGNYGLSWRDYSEHDGQRFGRFRWLAVHAMAGVVPTGERQTSKESMPNESPKSRARYSKLRGHLSSRSGARLAMTFGEIETIVGSLPASARQHRPWWANHFGNPQAVWLSAGWRVESVDMVNQRIVFARSKEIR